MPEERSSPALEQLEARRQAAQRAINGTMSDAERNRLGQFSTPPGLATDILEACRKELDPATPIRFLDPGGGTGVFFRALIEAFGSDRIHSAVSYEVAPEIANAARKLWSRCGLQVRCEDFTRADPAGDHAGRHNLIVCNPPYSRHHHLGRETKTRLRRRVRELTGLQVSGLAGLYVYFMLLAHEWLEDGGIAVWLIPSEALDVNYGAALREYLSSHVCLLRLHRFSATDVQFDDALVSSCVILFKKAHPAPGHVVAFTSGGALGEPESARGVTVADLRERRKWGPLLKAAGAGEVRPSAPAELAVGDLFEVRRGIVTGANDFFVLERRQAAELGLPRALVRPVLPSPRHVQTEVIRADKKLWPLVEPSLALLDCDLPRGQIERDHPELDAYLRVGERRRINERYLLSRRDPWYRQEVRAPAPLLCTYMARRGSKAPTFRFIRNHSSAIALNVYLMMYPKRAVQVLDARRPGLLDRLHDALRSLSDDLLVSAGREYGGGLHKLEPAELCRLPVHLNEEDARELMAAEQPVLPGLSRLTSDSA